MAEQGRDAAHPVGGLGRSLEELLEESRQLRKDVHTAEQARRRTNRIAFAGLATLALFVALLAIVVYQNNRTLEQAKATQDTIADCTSPAGLCYRQSQARTAAVVENLIKASTYMAQCARLRPGDSGPEFDRFLEACVEAKLRGRQPAVTPSPTPKATPTPAAGA